MTLQRPRHHLNFDDAQEVICTTTNFCVMLKELRDAVETVATAIAALQVHFPTE